MLSLDYVVGEMVIKEISYCLTEENGELTMLRIRLQRQTTNKQLSLDLHGEFIGFCYYWSILLY
jgi:hypothetical protein